jgi:hypothetical protein
MATASTTSGASDEVKVASLTLHCCQCDQPALDRLIEAVRDGIASRQVTLEATWQGTRLRQDGLAAIRAAISRSLDPGDPRQLDRLHIEARSADRTVAVALGDEAATVTVESGDAAWALGKAEQIRRILRHAGGRDRRRRWRPWRWAMTSGIAVAAVVAVLWPAGAIATAALAVGLVGGAAATGFLIARRMVYRSRAVIWIDGAMPRHGWRQWSIGDRLAALALLVAAFAAVVPLLTR